MANFNNFKKLQTIPGNITRISGTFPCKTTPTTTLKCLKGESSRAIKTNQFAKSYQTSSQNSLVFSKPHQLLTARWKIPQQVANFSTRVMECWKCSGDLDSSSEFGLLLCPHCQSPQKLRGTNIPDYYELLGHSKTYRVDVEELSLRTKRLQRKLHPDLYAQKAQEEQELSQELSSLINKAFGTLCDPIERGRYLLQLHGVQDPIGDVEKELTNDPQFLEEVMELNERLVELASEKDWMEFRTQNDISLHKLQEELSEAFKDKNITEAKLILGRMKYFDTLQGKLKELKSKLQIVE